VCVCNPPDAATGIAFSGPDCNTTTFPKPPPPPGCGDFSSNCTNCSSGTFLYNLDCEWCPAGLGNISQFLVNGTCMTSGLCPVTKGLKQCIPPQVIALNPCPDNCLGNGVCTDVTVDAACFNGVKDNNETDVDCGGPVCYPCKPAQACLVGTDCFTNICNNNTYVCDGSGFFTTGGNVTQKCVCNTGYSGSNCGVAPLVPSDEIIAIAGTLSAVAVVGIVIGAVICAGAVAGGGTYAYYAKASGDDQSPVMSNPLYRGDGNAGSNPIYRGN